jgi:hypothetical protein
MRMLTQLRVDEIAKFLGYFRVAGADYTAEILLKLFGFENPVFRLSYYLHAQVR